MWCRAVLVTIVALTYIVCVLILNGLQKEDLDVNTLKKLQRHNVNIDDMNNEALRKECETETRKPSTNQNTDISALKNGPPDIREKEEDQKIKLSDLNLQNIIINYFNNVQKTNKPIHSENVKNGESKPRTDLPNVENFMNVWNMLNRTKEHDVESTTKTIVSSVVTDATDRPNLRSDDKSIEYINKILEKLIAIQKVTTTIRPTTKLVDYDTIAQRIKELLVNTSNNKQSPLPTRFKVDEDKFGTDKVNEEIEVLNNDSIKYIDDIIKPTNPFDMFGPVRKNFSNRNIHFEDNNVQYQIKRRYLVDHVSPINIIPNAPIESQKYRKDFIKNQIKSLSEDIIRELSETVKANVLHDLKKVITTTKTTKLTTRYTTVKTTTTKQIEKSVTKVKPNNEKIDATDVLQKLMEMFQQYKVNQDITKLKKKNNAEDNSKSGNNAQLAHPTASNIYDIKPFPVNITSVIINPYNSIHTPLIQTAVLPNEPYTLLNINTPIHNKPMAKPLHKITQLNIFNTKNNYRTSPITMQTNSVEVPPLGLPAQQSMVYQNIVVSTKRPFEKVRNDFLPSYISHDRTHYGDNNRIELPPHPPQSRNPYNEYGINRHDRIKEFINDEYSKEIKTRKPIKYKPHGRSHYSGHNIERFHEELERADDCPQNCRSIEYRNIDYDNVSPKLISRHQFPLSGAGAKKRPRYDDAHFRNFMQTQQKVNNMLERILATKTIANEPRSVETTV